MGNRPGCEARRHSDQMQCGRCGLTWDVNDESAPECKKITTAAVAVKALLNSLEFQQPMHEKLLTLPPLPLGHLPAFGVRPGLYAVNWFNYPDVAFVAISHVPVDCQARAYLFYGHRGEPKFEVEIQEGMGLRQANIRDRSGPIPGEWRTA